MTTKTMPNAKPAAPETDKPKRKYERKANVPFTVYEVTNDGKGIGLFRSKDSAESFKATAGELAASMGGKVGALDIRERKVN